MSKTVGDIAIRLDADIAPFQQGMRKAQGDLRGFESRGKAMAATMAKVGAAVAASVAVVAAAGLALGRQAAQTATEIQNMSRVANASASEFQKMAAGARTVGIEQEKLADILKDVNDRVGDFLSTGGGPMADFFENIAPKIGVTVDQFARLSGPEALQLYVTSLQRAGVSQQEMTFYMEAMASDATALVPLLANNGTEMRRLGDEAQRSGRILSNDMVANGAALDRQMKDLSDTIRMNMNKALLEHGDELQVLVGVITDVVIPAVGLLAKAIGTIVDAVAAAVAGVRALVTGIGDALDAAGEGAVAPGDRVSGGNRRTVAGGPMETGLTPSGGPRRGGRRGAAPVVLPEIVFGPGVGRIDASGGGGSGGDMRGEFEALQEKFATEQELIAENYAMQLEQLREFRANKVATEEEFAELEARIHKDHLDRVASMEREQQAARLSMASGFLGSLADVLESGGKQNFEAVKGLRVAEALISGYQATIEAWRDGMTKGGPLLAAGQAAMSVARTGALISQMQSVSPGSGAGAGGGVSGGGGSAAPQAPLEFRMSGFDPSSLYSGRQISELFDALGDEAGDRGYRWVT